MVYAPPSSTLAKKVDKTRANQIGHSFGVRNSYVNAQWNKGFILHVNPLLMKQTE